MRKNIKRSPIKVTLSAAVLLAACLFASTANAQAWIQGRFTLPFEARWGQAVLPAGDYQLTFAPGDTPGMLSIRDAKSLRPVAFEPVNIREDSKQGKSALLIGTHGRQHVVYSLRIAELGKTFVYERPSARAVEEARKAQAVPVLVATK